MPDFKYIELVPFLPLITFVIIGLFGKKYLKSFSGILGTTVLLIAAMLSVYAAYQYFFVIGRTDGIFQQIVVCKYTWLQFGNNVSIDMGILLDPIAVMMCVVVTLISLLVHLYSIGYMKGEERYSVFYAFLALFTFSMLGLVLSSNVLQIYVFWELVGISSFLLIGFYYDKPSAVAASKKAFIVTRFADLGFLIGILVLSFYAGTLDFRTLIERLSTNTPYLHDAATASFLGFSALTWGLGLVFIGCAGKSAMFPLHIWLPDAMEGPTPVSALIHAATMVVAGVYLVAKLFLVYSLSCPGVLNVIAYVGVFSSLLAAIIACVQTDIKRVLAYSTISQIGYMIFALGVSRYNGEQGLGYMASMFHLFTHAMFKALLFLGAGAIIHYVHSNEMKDMGGLRKLMPITHITFLVACLSISGIPPFSGFFSKEEILLAAWNSNKFMYIISTATAGLTSFYIFRLYYNIFWSKKFVSHNSGHEEHHREGPGVMLVPLIVLGLLAIVTGFIPFGKYISADGLPLITEFHIQFSAIPILVAVTGIIFAYFLYKKENPTPQKIYTNLNGFSQTVYRKFYVDETYLFVTKKVIFNIFGRILAWIDIHIINGCINLSASLTDFVSSIIKGLQSGKLQQYAIYFLVSALGFALLFIYLWT